MRTSKRRELEDRVIQNLTQPWPLYPWILKSPYRDTIVMGIYIPWLLLLTPDLVLLYKVNPFTELIHENRLISFKRTNHGLWLKVELVSPYVVKRICTCMKCVTKLLARYGIKLDLVNNFNMSLYISEHGFDAVAEEMILIESSRRTQLKNINSSS